MRHTAGQRATLALLAALILLPLAHPIAAGAQQQQPQGQSKPAVEAPAAADVEVKTTKETTWYANPTWIIVGLVVLALVVVLVFAGRGSNTTVIKS